ncbi:MAG: hypothetical protein GXY38_03355 [Planctomycetes bacterium]|nr:hypothetical protein [Planctomycetota bacterium]
MLLRRVRHARASLDAAEIARYSLLKRRYLLEGGEPATFPLDLVSAVERLKQTMTEQAQQRLDKAKLDKTVGRMAEKLDLYASMNRDWPLPEQFRGYKAHELVEFTPPAIPRVVAPAQVVGDPTSECGLAIRVPLADSLEPDSIILKAGIHQQSGMPTKVVVSEGLPLSYKDATSSPGYHWRKLLGNAQVQSDSKFFVAMPTCWNVQFQCDRPMSSGKSGQYDFWGRVKVERSTTQDENGANEKEYLYLERVLMVRTR